MSADEARSLDHQPHLALGYLVSLPLFAVYEVGLAATGGSVGRNSSEVLIGLAFDPLGPFAGPVRWTILGVLALIAWRHVRREELDLPHELARTVLEGVAAAVLLGPLLIWLLSFFEGAGQGWEAGAGPPDAAPPLALALRLVGAAPWEELLFRVGAFGICYLLVSRIAAFFGSGRRLAYLLGDLAALLGSSLLFAAFHLDLLQRFLGRAGEPFDGAVFLWRLLAGLLLAGLFRWRGLGTCAWAHGVFNVGLALGAGPGVFLGP